MSETPYSWDSATQVLSPGISVLEYAELESLLDSAGLSLFPTLFSTASGSLLDLVYRDRDSESASESRDSPYFSASCRLLSALYLAILSALDSRPWVSMIPEL